MSGVTWTPEVTRIGERVEAAWSRAMDAEREARSRGDHQEGAMWGGYGDALDWVLRLLIDVDATEPMTAKDG